MAAVPVGVEHQALAEPVLVDMDRDGHRRRVGVAHAVVRRTGRQSAAVTGTLMLARSLGKAPPGIVIGLQQVPVGDFQLA